MTAAPSASRSLLGKNWWPPVLLPLTRPNRCESAPKLIVATGGGDLALVSVPVGHPAPPAPDALRDQAAAFLASTSVVPDDRDLCAHLAVTDGVRTWEPDDLATIPLPPAADPAWLRVTAASNHARFSAVVIAHLWLRTVRHFPAAPSYRWRLEDGQARA